MFEFHELTYNEYIENLKVELYESCLYDAVKRRCDSINFEVSTLGYAQHRYIQEELNEILTLIEQAERKDK